MIRFSTAYKSIGKKVLHPKLSSAGNKVLYLLVFVIFMFSCKDELTLDPDNTSSVDASRLVAIDLPGVFGVGLSKNSTTNSRADNVTSDGNSFNDGTAEEYALALPDPQNGEYYHYLLIYDPENTSATPTIFPIDVTRTEFDKEHPNDNVTLTVSKLLSNEDNGNPLSGVSSDLLQSSGSLVQFLKNKQYYILLNFQLKDSDSPNYSFNGNRITGATTADKLKNLTLQELESVRMFDHSIHNPRQPSLNQPDSGTDENDGTDDGTPQSTLPTDFFIMTNSVYSNGSAKVVDGTFNAEKIYSTEEEALANPALTAHVERLASKFTISFETGKWKNVNFGPSQADSYPISDVTFPNNDGLPMFTTTVRKVDMVKSDQNSGIQFTDKGYEIMWNPVTARIKILGFGLSNNEPSMNLFKDINSSYGTTWSWNDPSNHRCYWSQDPHYALSRSQNDVTFTKVTGYPHQFRKALDTDSVTSFHAGGYTYQSGKEVRDDYVIDGTSYESYAQLGDIDLTQTIADLCYLNYKSFGNLSSEFKSWNLNFSRATTSGGIKTTFEPIYSLENTYIDQGMLTNNAETWRWPWQRAPYATATNLMVLAQIEIEDNYASEASGNSNNILNQGVKITRDTPSGSSEFSNVRTVYLGQNNIFYLRKVNLLKSKLAILNQVMLSGGNAGIQILNGQWDRHQGHDENDLNKNDETLLDKVAWNENSKLWFAKVKWKDDNSGPDYDKIETTDEDGNVKVSYVIKYEEGWPKLVTIDNSDTADEDKQYLDLIPAEISGGDGQCLIAPNENYMGAHYRYYLAPEAEGSTELNPVMDTKLAVEISYNHLVALIHKIIGPVDVYTNGLMYYSVPVPHRILQYGGNVNTDAWKYMGAFSVVRNNWYDISVTEITKLGTPVHDLNQPIIPVMDVKRSYINMGVELKDFHDIIQDNIPMM